MMPLQTFRVPGAALACYGDIGGGVPFLFQHGLGGSAAQTAEVMPELPGVRRLTLECRGHGGSEAGDPSGFTLATFTADAASLLETIGGPAIIGGISMGAAIASRLAVTNPKSVRALILARPAWVTAPAPENVQAYREVGELLSRFPAPEARARFSASTTAQRLTTDAPDNLATLEGFFSRAPLNVTAELLTRIASDGPGITATDLSRIACPVLIIGHGRDVAHPLAACLELAALIPRARLIEITPKAEDKIRYVSDFKAALSAFLKDVIDGKTG